ncbi:amidase [Pseudomonas sp. CCC3.1]|uniref:amidase n=1 Tax=Pseudomonas sp. CCC3.1 TaxID=3048607 RepID=UPI002AC99A10|nr:amidase [Pseudomonas sp. CCC3.1]MEB0207503.1 amidase [Pseudomonas sp. CCC3.1]WPX37049.1 amidase [Pseudomonas sp. CCC3.1]
MSNTLNQLSPRDYLALDATAMVAAIKSGEISGPALLQAAQARCDAVNPQINAVVMRHDAHAQAVLKAQREAGTDRLGALASVPMLLKDLNTYLKDTVTTNGSRLLADTPPSRFDSTIVQRYQAAGMVIFGKTASPEFGLTTTTESSLWGKTCNPWNLAHSAGGSSGGAAAAVAAGIVPVAHATDGGGSIRIPASYCGVFGLKPTRYRNPQGPNTFEGWFGASCGHVVSRSVRDSALLLDISHGHEKGSTYWLAPQIGSFSDAVQRAPKALRIGVIEQAMTGLEMEADIRTVLNTTVDVLLQLGHHVAPLSLPIDPQQVYSAHGAVGAAALLAAVRDREAALGRAFEEDELHRVSRYVLNNATSASAENLYRARRGFELIGSRMEQVFDDFDVLLSPVTSSVTPLLSRASLDNDYEDYIQGVIGSIGYTVLANVSGQPSMSVPLGTSREGLPIGMMFSAALCREDLLFQLAGQLEQACPWADRRAPL